MDCLLQWPVHIWYHAVVFYSFSIHCSVYSLHDGVSAGTMYMVPCGWGVRGGCCQPLRDRAQIHINPSMTMTTLYWAPPFSLLGGGCVGEIFQPIMILGHADAHGHLDPPQYLCPTRGMGQMGIYSMREVLYLTFAPNFQPLFQGVVR